MRSDLVDDSGDDSTAAQPDFCSANDPQLGAFEYIVGGQILASPIVGCDAPTLDASRCSLWTVC